MATITKIEGWAWPNKAVDLTPMVFSTYQARGEDVHPATLLISSDATPPSVMTEDEHREKVKAMLKELAYDEYVDDFHQKQRVKQGNVFAIAAAHGIDLTT